MTKFEASIQNYTDTEMARIMIIENLTQRGQNAGAVLDSVAAAARRICLETFDSQKFLTVKDVRREHILAHEVMQHTRGALNFEASQDLIIETILHCAPYIGFPRTNHALRAAQSVFDSWEDEKEDWKPLGSAPPPQGA